MAKTFHNLIANQKKIDLFYEMIDARAPLSCLNLKLNLPIHKHIYIISKTDLVSNSDLKTIKKYFLKCQNKVYYTSKNNVGSLKQQLIKHVKLRNKITTAFVFGVPNVGKSSLINAMINHKANIAYNLPGVTKHLKINKITNFFYLCDTPGLLWPQFENESQAYNLALIGSIVSKILPLEEILKYAWNYLNMNYHFLYKEINLDINETDSSELIETKLLNKYNFKNNYNSFLQFFYHKLINNIYFAVCWDKNNLK